MQILEAFLDGVTAAGLFGKLTWPGAPTELVDSRPMADFMAEIPAYFEGNGAPQAIAIAGRSSAFPATPSRVHK